MSEELLYFNGINGVNGKYLLSSMTLQQISQIIQGESKDKDHIQELKWWYDNIAPEQRGPKEGVDPQNLAEAGWGIIFADRDKERVPVIMEALGELLTLRQEQAGEYYRVYTGEDGYQLAETKLQFLRHHGIGPGPADPEKVPYYLLIVGDPEAIPYHFQYQLDVQYAVGRIHFDTLGEYAGYAHSVAEAEMGKTFLPPKVTFFGTQNPGDPATHLSANELVIPLSQTLAEGHPDSHVQVFAKEQADKARLKQLLGGSETPSLLFTASHGMGFPEGDSRQLLHQGALLCQDWPGPKAWRQAIPQDFYFAADDIGDDADLQGLLTFHFACYSVGTPRLDDFAHQAFRRPMAIAPNAFVARLPQRLLGHPKGGALAVIGHVERAWGYSFIWGNAGRQLAVFESTLKRLMQGQRIGWAMEYLDQRYAELSTLLSEELHQMSLGRKPDYRELAGMWTANNDARNYVVIGDPAARLPSALM